MTYGAIVADMIKHYNADTAMINAKLLDLGTKIGERMADEFLAYKTNDPCSNIKDVGDRLTKVVTLTRL